METQIRNMFYKDDDFNVETQIHGDCVFLHVHVDVWSLSVIKRMYRVYAELEDTCVKAGFSRMATITPNPKFVKLFGGRTIETLTINNEHMEVIVWDLIRLAGSPLSL